MDRAELLRRLYFPPVGTDETNRDFMIHADCSSLDFRARKFVDICTEIGEVARYHRKQWEWVYIIHHLRNKGMILPSKRGLVFGVGTEPLPSLFARDGAEIVATDAPPEIDQGSGWSDSNQYGNNLDAVFKPDIIDRASFDERVSHAFCDMNAIAPEFNGFDFCWSSCCLEQLGSLEHGIEFIINSVEKTLKVGGIACHTTEFNLSSNDETLTAGPTVIYRKRDIQELVDRLRARGHIVDDVIYSNSQTAVDTFVDLPPYSDGFPHIRLELEKYVVTSVGVVVRRGR